MNLQSSLQLSSQHLARRLLNSYCSSSCSQPLGARRVLNSCCSSEPQSNRRAFIAIVLTTLSGQGLVAQDARAGLEKYMKKKKLDPLETYIPGIILCQSQLHELETKLVPEGIPYQEARSLLRTGPAGSLRTNIRAVAQYATESGDGATATDAVKSCLRSLEELDSLLLRASRDDNSITVESMKDKLGASMNALDRLLQTVPGPILEKGKAVAMAFLEDVQEEEAMDDLKSFIPSTNK